MDWGPGAETVAMVEVKRSRNDGCLAHPPPRRIRALRPGPHQCPGSGLAGVQMAATTATILHHCGLELAEPELSFPHVLRPPLRRVWTFPFASMDGDETLCPIRSLLQAFIQA